MEQVQILMRIQKQHILPLLHRQKLRNRHRHMSLWQDQLCLLILYDLQRIQQPLTLRLSRLFLRLRRCFGIRLLHDLGICIRLCALTLLFRQNRPDCRPAGSRQRKAGG